MRLAEKILSTLKDSGSANLNQISESASEKVFKITVRKDQQVWRGVVKESKISVMFDEDAFNEWSDKYENEETEHANGMYSDEKEKFDKKVASIKKFIESEKKEAMSEFKNLKLDYSVIDVSDQTGKITFTPPNKFIKLSTEVEHVDDLEGDWEYDGSEVNVTDEDNFGIKR